MAVHTSKWCLGLLFCGMWSAAERHAFLAKSTEEGVQVCAPFAQRQLLWLRDLVVSYTTCKCMATATQPS